MRSLFRTLLAAVALPLLACGSSDSNDAAAGPCDDLASCCGAMSDAATRSSCESELSSARQAQSSASTCQALATEYVAIGACKAPSGPSGGSGGAGPVGSPTGTGCTTLLTCCATMPDGALKTSCLMTQAQQSVLPNGDSTCSALAMSYETGGLCTTVSGGLGGASSGMGGHGSIFPGGTSSGGGAGGTSSGTSGHGGATSGGTSSGNGGHGASTQGGASSGNGGHGASTQAGASSVGVEPQDCGAANDEIGCCDGDTLYYCSSGVLSPQACDPGTCGWNTMNGYYDCATTGKSDPGGVPQACRASTGEGGSSSGVGGMSSGAGGAPTCQLTTPCTPGDVCPSSVCTFTCGGDGTWQESCPGSGDDGGDDSGDDSSSSGCNATLVAACTANGLNCCVIGLGAGCYNGPCP